MLPNHYRQLRRVPPDNHTWAGGNPGVGNQTAADPPRSARFLPELIRLTWDRKINPGKVFDLTLPLDQAAGGYRAMDTRRAVKTLLTL